MKMMKQSYSVDLMTLALGFRTSRLFLTAVELRLFETIGCGCLALDEIAVRSGTEPRALQILMDALTGLGLTEKQESGYGNSSVVRDLLRMDSTGGAMAFFRHQSNSWQNWSAFTDVVRQGYPGSNRPSHQESLDFAAAMRLGAKQVAERLDLMLDFSGIYSLCDMGCGPGEICLELLKMHPHLTARLMDYEEDALAVAARAAGDRGLQARVEIVCQDILAGRTDRSFDMVLMSLVLCLFKRDDTIRLLNHAKAVLKPGGILLLGEVLLDSSRTSPVSATLFNAHLLAMGSRGSLFTLDEIRGLMRSTGMHYEKDFPAGNYQLIVGRNVPE
jgi:3-hydroxy-5-methyl-1-naphthoate 3-O-methyltransferase